MAEDAVRKRRLFAGIQLDEESRVACASVSAELQRTSFDARYEAPEKLHVTLAFLGFVEPSRFEAIAERLALVAERSAPFAISLDKLGAFPHERKPGIVYIGAREQGAAFRTIASAIRSEYARLGFDFHNDPIAHVTIARVKERGRPLPLVHFDPIPLRIDRLTLFESLPDPANNTSRYEVARSVNLPVSS